MGTETMGNAYHQADFVVRCLENNGCLGNIPFLYVIMDHSPVMCPSCHLEGEFNRILEPDAIAITS